MSLARISRIVALIVVLVVALVPGLPELVGVVVALAGLWVGYHVSAENRGLLFLVAIALATGVAEALSGIPAIGMYLTDILSTYGDLVAAAAVTVAVTIAYERLMESG